MSYSSVNKTDFRSDKATTAPSSSKTTSVNRRLREALSPSPDASPRSPSPPYSRARERSRSPYRASRSPPGGWKRRRNDDLKEDSYRTNSREHRRQYDDRRYDDRRTFGRYDARDGVARKERDDYDDRNNEYGSKRRRTRSPSPPLPQRSRSPPTRSAIAGRRDSTSNRSFSSNKQNGVTEEKAGEDRARISFRQGAGLSTSEQVRETTTTTEVAKNGESKPEKGVR